MKRKEWQDIYGVSTVMTCNDFVFFSSKVVCLALVCTWALEKIRMSSNPLEPTQFLSSAETPWIDLLQIAPPLPYRIRRSWKEFWHVLTRSLSSTRWKVGRGTSESAFGLLGQNEKRGTVWRFCKFQRAEIATSFIQVFNFLPGVILIT